MLNFCPFDFREIDVNNLAYELVFVSDWNWDRVKKETILAGKTLPFISENDKKREKHYKTDTTKQHVILLEAPKGTDIENNGLNQLIRLVGEDSFEDDTETDEERTDIDYEKYGEATPTKKKEYSKIYGSKMSSKIKLSYKSADGVTDGVTEGSYTFFDEDGDEVMYALPCCPKCHCRLPLGWLGAEDFGGVSLMAPTSGGKTTLLCSMLNSNWEAFKNVSFSYDRNVFITAAHLRDDDTDSEYVSLVQKAEKMCKRNGDCPNNTPTDKWVYPVFLKVQFEGHRMIIGIYDNAGENLKRANPYLKPNLKATIDKMFAEICLFDPEELNIELPSRKTGSIMSEKSEEEKVKCRLLSLEEQGNLQKKERDTRKSVSSILNAERYNSPAHGNLEIKKIYDNIVGPRMGTGLEKKMKNEMYFQGVLIKSDLLKTVRGIGDDPEFDMLFERETDYENWSYDAEKYKSNIVRKLFEKMNLLGTTRLGYFERNYDSAHVFWHCVSALGCDAELAGKLFGEYDPIRVAEPLLNCIMNRIVDNGWY